MTSELLLAAKNGYYAKVLSLLNKGVHDLDARDKDQQTPLYWSACRGHVAICRALVEAGCDVNARIKWGSTALHGAADRGHVDCLDLLVQSGAEVNLQNARGDTAMHVAAYRGYKEILQRLVQAGADPFLKNSQSKNPLQEAQALQHTGAAMVLQKYIESLGCLPFKSLPESGMRRSPTTEDHSVPAKSWPRYQPFSKPQDKAAEQDPRQQKNHTYPLTLNDLSSPKSGDSYNGKASVSDPDLGWSNNGKASVNYPHLGWDDPPSLKVYKKEHGHREPQENADECIGNGCVRLQRDGPATDDHSQRVPQNSPYHGARLDSDNVIRLLNKAPLSGHDFASDRPGRPASEDFNDFSLTGSEVGVPNISAPPPRVTRGSFVNHEDLTQFAESLQMEVVNLRDTLSVKDGEISALRNRVASLTAEKAQLQHTVPRSLPEDSTTLKKLAEMEKQNLCLQQALVQMQTRAGKVAEERDVEVTELRVKVSELEQLNSSLQRLLVSQQEDAKEELRRKDDHVAQLSRKLQVTWQQVLALRQQLAVLQPRSAVNSESGPLPLLLSRHSDSSFQSVPGDQIKVDFPVDSDDTPKSVISVCDRFPVNVSGDTTRASSSSSCIDYLTQPFYETQTSNPTAQSLLKRGTADNACPMLQRMPEGNSSVTLMNNNAIDSKEKSHITPAAHTLPTNIVHDPLRTLQSKLPPQYSNHPEHANNADAKTTSTINLQHGDVCSADSQVTSLWGQVTRLLQDDVRKLDADGREWKVGREFQLLDPFPVDCGEEGRRTGSSSFTFSIKHRGRNYVLKMLTLPNRTSLSPLHDTPQARSHRFLQHHRFGEGNLHPLLLLTPHFNLARVRHHYQGETTQFRDFVPLAEIPYRATFLVLDRYPQTLRSLVDQERARNLPEQFWAQVAYQLLSAVEFLGRLGVTHRDIRAENVFLDERLRPVLGDFEWARSLRVGVGEAVLLTDAEQVLAGNPHAWAPELCRLRRCGPASLSKPMTLEEVYSKSDSYAVSRMIYHLLCTADANNGNRDDDRFPTSSLQQPDYPDSSIPALPAPISRGLHQVLRSLVLNDPADRPTVKEALCRVGLLLSMPSCDIPSLESAETLCVSQLKALAVCPDDRPSPPEGVSFSVTESVAANQNMCLADFYLRFGGSDLWAASRHLRGMI